MAVPDSLMVEKLTLHHSEDVTQSPPDQSSMRFSPEAQKRIIRKIDRRLLPILGLMYAVSLMDRTNLGLAAVAGMNEDLALDSRRYTIIVMTFFVMYIVFEIPSNIMLQKVGPKTWLSFLGVSFGAISIGMGFTRSFETMAICRTLLGVMEAGFLPGCTFLISCWYTRYEVGKRLGAFWMLSVLFAGFAAIFAYGLTQLKGTQGLNGWRWIFIIEGLVTVVLCLAAWFIIAEFPSKASFLTTEEQQFVIDRINEDRGDAVEDEVTLKVVLFHLRDPLLYAWSFMLFATTVPGYSYSYFLPLILRKSLGYSATKAQLLTAPPYVLAAVLVLTSSWLADHFKIRAPLIVFHQAMTFTGMLMTAFATNPSIRLLGAYLGLGFVQYAVIGILTWQANNITSHSKRAVAAGTCLMGGGLGGIVSSLAFSTDAPRYRVGVFLSVGLCLASITVIGFTTLYFVSCNRQARQGRRRINGMEDWYFTY